MQFDEASWITLDRRNGETLRCALERELRAAILDGSLRAGARLPSSRVLARTIGVSRGVTSDAYGQLEAQGFLSIAPRASPIVASVERGLSTPGARTDEAQPRFDFIPTTPDVNLFPRRLFASALAEAARTASTAALDYGDPAGLAELRLALADHLGLTRGVVTSPEQIADHAGHGPGDRSRAARAQRAGRLARRVEDPSLVEPAAACREPRSRGARPAGRRARPRRRRPAGRRRDRHARTPVPDRHRAAGRAPARPRAVGARTAIAT